MRRGLTLALLALLALPTRALIAQEIDAVALRRDLEVLAADGMEGRRTATRGDARAVSYLERELRRIAGLRPLSGAATFRQPVPLIARALRPGAGLTIDGRRWRAWRDFGIDTFDPVLTRSVDGAEVVMGGTIGADTLLDAGAARGRLVLLAVGGTVDADSAVRALIAGRLAGAAGIALLDLYAPTATSPHPPYVGLTREKADSAPDRPTLVYLTARMSSAIAPPRLRARVGARLGHVRGDLRRSATPVVSYNVVALLPGRDSAGGEYVVVGAHHDHVGIGVDAVDHDSLRYADSLLHAAGAADPITATGAQRAEAMRRLVGARLPRSRRDSIRNGADDDASGSAAVLAIARALAARHDRLAHSVLFVWHTGEELGFYGARRFTDSLPVPADSVLAMLELDMVGRGAAADVEDGGPDYLQAIGAGRRASALPGILAAAGEEPRFGIRLRYGYDAPDHPLHYYCRSDQVMYARLGIPVVFFTTGPHLDYHQVTDEARYIDRDKLARVTRLVADVTTRLASLERPLARDVVLTDEAGCGM